MNYNVDKSYKSIFEGKVVKTEYATEFTYHNCNLLDEMAKGFTEIYKKKPIIGVTTTPCYI